MPIIPTNPYPNGVIAPTIVAILRSRDALSLRDAEEIVLNCRLSLEDALLSGNLQQAEKILKCHLNLDIDYLLNVLSIPLGVVAERLN